jgi:D-3-phosphoglycerate dehydrogenase / 2-oxoglutarate reductase
MKVLIADKLSKDAVTALQKLGLEVEMKPDLTAENLPGACADVNILVVRSKKVTSATIQAAKQLALIIRAGAGVDTIDLAAASARGIYVANCPGKNTNAVAELAIGLLIAADRRIVNATVDLRNGAWKKKEYGNARGLAGRTLGILGLGAIGRTVARTARAMGMKIVAWEAVLPHDEPDVTYVDTPLKLAAASDAVTVHLASTPETKHTVNKAFLDAMKPGTILVNASRGALVDTAALKKAIAEKKLRVAVDVFEGEPTAGEAEFADKELAAMITATPHVGASTDQAAEAIAQETVRIVDLYLKTGHPAGVVNISSTSSATHRLVIRHYNRVGVLAFVLAGMREEGINIEETENMIFAGSQAACCSMLLDQAPSAKLIHEIQANPNILHAQLTVCS